VYCNEKNLLMRHWPCGASCCYISFQLRVAAVHRLLHQYHGVWQHGGCNLFSICQGKRLIYLQTQPFFQSACSSLIIIARGISRLDGPRGKKQVWRPHVRNEVLWGANVLHWRKYMGHCWDFWTPPKSYSAPGALCTPWASSLRPW